MELNLPLMEDNITQEEIDVLISKNKNRRHTVQLLLILPII